MRDHRTGEVLVVLVTTVQKIWILMHVFLLALIRMVHQTNYPAVVQASNVRRFVASGPVHLKQKCLQEGLRQTLAEHPHFTYSIFYWSSNLIAMKAGRCIAQLEYRISAGSGFGVLFNFVTFF